MAIKIGNKVYRNIQEQVAKNQEDIAGLEERIPSVPYGVLELDLEGGSGTLTDEQYDLIADRRTVFIKPNTSSGEVVYYKCKEDDTYFYFVSYVDKYTYTQEGKTSLYQEDFFVSKQDKSWGYSNIFSTQFYSDTQANARFQIKPTWHMYVASSYYLDGESGNVREFSLNILSTYATLDDLKQHINEFYLWDEDDNVSLNTEKFQIAGISFTMSTEDNSNICVLKDLDYLGYSSETNYFYAVINYLNTHDDSVSYINMNFNFIQVF